MKQAQRSHKLLVCFESMLKIASILLAIYLNTQAMRLFKNVTTFRGVHVYSVKNLIKGVEWVILFMLIHLTSQYRSENQCLVYCLNSCKLWTYNKDRRRCVSGGRVGIPQHVTNIIDFERFWASGPYSLSKNTTGWYSVSVPKALSLAFLSQAAFRYQLMKILQLVNDLHTRVHLSNFKGISISWNDFIHLNTFSFLCYFLECMEWSVSSFEQRYVLEIS